MVLFNWTEIKIVPNQSKRDQKQLKIEIEEIILTAKSESLPSKFLQLGIHIVDNLISDPLSTKLSFRQYCKIYVCSSQTTRGKIGEKIIP